MKIKSTFLFDEIANAKLESIACKTGQSKSEVLRHALTLYDYLLQNAYFDTRHDQRYLTFIIDHEYTDVYF